MTHAKVWAEPRPTSSRKDRQKMLLGEIQPGEVFVVKKHFRNGSPLWIRLRLRDRDLEGWIVSLPAEPFVAKLVSR
jgi:hypothetical protein